jgi:hypothetical protein
MEATPMRRKVLVVIGATIGLAALWASGTAYAGASGDAICGEKKAKATGKKAGDLLKALGKNLKKPNAARLAADVSKAQSKFTKAFAKAEGSDGCATQGDVGPIDAKVDAFVNDAARVVIGFCGNDRLDPGEECDGTAVALCANDPFPGCGAPGSRRACQCCGNSICEFGPCCDPTATCVPAPMFSRCVGCAQEGEQCVGNLMTLIQCCGEDIFCFSDAIDPSNYTCQALPELTLLPCTSSADCFFFQQCENAFCCSDLGAECYLHDLSLNFPCCGNASCSRRASETSLSCCLPADEPCTADTDCCSRSCNGSSMTCDSL